MGLRFHVRASRQGKYFEAICTDIDPEERSLVACFPPEAGLDDTCFKVPYDMLILGAALPGMGTARCALSRRTLCSCSLLLVVGLVRSVSCQ